MNKKTIALIAAALCGLCTFVNSASAQGTVFTYQGQLSSSGVPANGTFDFVFELYNDPTIGSQQGATLTNLAVAVTNGLFLATNDFGVSPWTGQTLWIQLFVRTNTGATFTSLSPRQAVTSTPYAIQALNAANAANAVNVTGLLSNSILPGFQGPNYEVVNGGSGNIANAVYTTIAGGQNNLASNSYATVGGGASNSAAGNASSIGGGVYNSNYGYIGTIAGGFNNLASNAFVTIGGGYANIVNGDSATVAGGQRNTATDNASTVGGGYLNVASGQFYGYATVAGGTGNNATSDYAFVGGGTGNTASTYFATVGGGEDNTATGPENNGLSTVAGGQNNTANTDWTFIGGGQNNFADAFWGTIGGGYGNVIGSGAGYDVGGRFATIGGGSGNTNNSFVGTIAGGQNNYVLAPGGEVYQGTIGGGYNNLVTNSYATVPGGFQNVAGGLDSFAAGNQAQALFQGDFVWADSQSGVFASTATNQFSVRANGGVVFITSGAGMTLDGQPIFSGKDGAGLTNLTLNNTNDSVVAGGLANNVTGSESGVFSGENNTNNANQSSIAGGGGNTIQSGAYYAFIGSGGGDIIGSNADDSFIGAGYHNLVGSNAAVSFLGGGQNNCISNNALFAFLGGGYNNTNTGSYSVIPGGQNNLAAANSFAAGNTALATNANSFVWSDGSTNTGSLTNNSVTLRATNGLRFLTGSNGSIVFTNAGATGAGEQVSWTPGGGAWAFTSDRNAKDRFESVDAETVLDKVAQLPIAEWSYKGHDQRHIGAMAQDFHALFPLNDNDKALNDADLHGVELAAIKGLNQKLEAKDTEISELKQALFDLKQTVQSLAAKR